MTNCKLVGLLFSAWEDLDRAIAGLSPEDAVRSLDGGSSFAWTVGHLANQLDAWTNVRFQKRPPHKLIGQERFRIGGSGLAEDWEATRSAALEVRAAARSYLEGLRDEDLDLVIPYDGSFLHVRESGLDLRYALLRTIAHHYFHIGEIATKRAALGHDVGDYPGPLAECL